MRRAGIDRGRPMFRNVQNSQRLAQTVNRSSSKNCDNLQAPIVDGQGFQEFSSNNSNLAPSYQTNCVSDDVTQNHSELEIGVIRAIKGSVQKRILNVDGKPVKDSAHNLGIAQGRARKESVNGLYGLAELLKGLRSNESLTLGTHGRELPVTVLTREKSKESNSKGNHTISRTLDNYSWPEQHAVLLDHDPEPGQPELNADEFWKALIDCVPELASIGRLVTVSTSSAIYDKATGECLKPATGHHTYLAVRGDIEKLKRLLEVRTWLNGKGFHKLATPNAQNGTQAILKRTLIDLTVFSPERLVYEAGAILPDEWEQRRPAPVVHDGAILDIATLPNITPEEQALFDALVKQSWDAADCDRKSRLVVHIKKENPGIKPSQAKKQATKLITAADRGTLDKDHALYLSNGQIITAGEIGPEHHGLTLHDPQEPTYRGGRGDVAKIFCAEPGSWTINSFAHGGCKYRPGWGAFAGVLKLVKDLDDKKAKVAGIKEAKRQKRLEYFAKFCKRLGIKPAETIEAARLAINNSLTKRQLLSNNHQTGWFSEIKIANARQLTVLDGQKRTGKTSGAISKLTKTHQTGLVICPTRVLARAASKVLNIGCYLDGIDSQWLTICPESLHKVAHKDFECIVFDEANEDIQRTQDGSLGTNPKGCRAALEQLLPAAKHVVVATDATYRATIAAVQRLGGFSPDEVVTIQRKRPASDMTVFTYFDWHDGDSDGTRWDGTKDDRPQANDAFYSWFAGIVEKIKAGKKVLIPCGSQEKARMIDRVLRAMFAGSHTGQCLDGPYTPGKIKKAFAENPNGWPQQQGLSWLIFTPVFNSGVSIEADYWDCQYEYISALETATAASQRGERLRTLLDGSITERHVYISNRGLPAEPDVDLFFPEFWRSILTGGTKLSGGAKTVGKALGVADAIQRFETATLAELDQLRELPEYWAIQARELYFKRETLEAEWTGNGWTVGEGYDCDADDIKEYRGWFSEIREGIIGTQARALGKAKPLKGNGDDGPIAAVKDRKYRLCEKVGESFPQLHDDAWLAAWEIAPGTSGGINAVRIRALVQMSYEQPELWKNIQYMDALKTVAISTEAKKLPKTPATSKEIALAQILSKCRTITDILREKITQWTKATPGISEAAGYFRAKAMELAQLSKHSQRIYGLKFTANTPAIKCLHKALSLIGLEAITAGRTPGQYRYWQYRLQTTEDINQRIQKMLESEKSEPPSPDDYREQLRVNTRDELIEQISDHIKRGYESFLKPWQVFAQNLTNQGCPELQLLRNLSTEVLDKLLNKQINKAFETVSSPEEYAKLLELTKPEQRLAAWEQISLRKPELIPTLLRFVVQTAA